MEHFLVDEKRQHKFKIKEMVDGEERTGEFVAKYPSLIDELEIDVRMSNYLKGGNPDMMLNSAKELAYMLATADVLLLEKPDWFDPSKMGDDKFLRRVVEEIFEFQNSFRGRNGANKPSKPSVGEESKETVEGK